MTPDFEKLVAISGMPGLYQIVTNRNNGLVVEDLDTGKRKFTSARRHQFTPLASVGIFTDDGGTAELAGIFNTIAEKEEELPLPGNNANPEMLRNYFSQILPNFDRDQVFVGDIKKVIKWYRFLKERNLVPVNASEEEE